MAIIKKIFLASSEELQEDRRAFEIMLARLNPQWRSRDITFEIVVWENFIDAMSKEGLQKEYNQAIQDCDVFVMLFFTKVGRYTLEEFEAAFADLEAGTGPKIYTYFRNDFILTGNLDENVRGLLDFKARLHELKHYPTLYRNTEDLQWQFSRQLEMLYGGDGATGTELSDATPQSKVGEIALVLSYRQLFGDGGSGTVDPARLANAVRRSSRQVRTAILNMAQDLRRETWFADKHRMEHTILVFEALVQADPKWHVPYGNLGYALKDTYVPDYKRALENLNHAVELRGDRFDEGAFYQYSRALCLMNLDAKYLARQPSDPDVRGAILEALRAARRELDSLWDWDKVMENPDATDVRTWLELNGSPRLR
jgi:hypothetical protein